MDLKIFVTHTSNKNDETIKNPLYVDVVAGAVNQKKTMPEGFVGDNTGENISDKNKYYCELSTQYWAWKNVEADYYGFCHYRRYMTLSSKDYSDYGESTRRGQINSSILSPETVKMFGLENADEMKKYVEQFDVIVPVEQDLSKLPTCQGIKKDVYGHFAGHDRMFMHAPDLDLLMELIDELFPEYSDDAKKFMRQPKFWGFNCFVMKKALFYELCEFEFTILEEMEKRIDNTYYNRQQSRIYGFMAEILSCLYFYHLKKERKDIRFGETQLIYFEHTEKIKTLEPKYEDGINVAFDLSNVENEPYFFSISATSFLETMNTEKKYNIVLMHRDMPKCYLESYKKQFETYGNIYVDSYNWKDIECEIKDKHLDIADCRVLLPWVLSGYKKCLVLCWNVLFSNSIDGLYNLDMNGKTISATIDPLFTGHVRAIDPRYEKYLKKYFTVDEHGLMHSSEVYLMDLEKARKQHEITDFVKKTERERVVTYGELLNSVYYNEYNTIPMKNVYYYTEIEQEIKTINQCPLSIADEYANTKEPVVTIYSAQMISSVSGTEMSLKLREAIDLSLYHSYFYGFGRGEVNTNKAKSKAIKKIDGGFRCIEDHGFWYTLIYAFKKPFIK